MATDDQVAEPCNGTVSSATLNGDAEELQRREDDPPKPGLENSNPEDSDAASIPKLQRQVTDLTQKLQKMEELLSKVNVETLLQKLEPKKAGDDSESESENGDADEDSDEDKSSKADTDSINNYGKMFEDDDVSVKSTSDAAEEDEPGSEPVWKLRHVKPKTIWRLEMVECRSETSAVKSAAILVYYELPDGSNVPQDDTPTGVLPIRICINSARLDELLQNATGLSLPAVPYTALPPYRVFVSNHEKIKEMLERLDKSFTSDFKLRVDDITQEMLDSPADLPQPPSSHDAEPQSLQSRRKDILLLRCFIEMSEKFLAPLINMSSRIADRTLQTISFRNLWYLYRPGDVIFGREPVGPKKYDAYRVFCVTGGRPSLKYLTHTQSEGRDPSPTYSDLKLHCYSWRYTGSRLVPSVKVVSIRPFEGEKPIKNLAYFPKQFCSPDDDILKHLIARGERFQRSRYGHGRYNGTTLPPNSWHIDEEVFVDFQSGYEFKSDWREFLDETLAIPDIDENGTWEPRCSLKGCKSCGTCNITDEKLDLKLAETFKSEGKYTLDITDDAFSGLDQDQLVMLPRELLGYGLRSKDWFFFDLDKFEMIDASTEKRQQAFNDLVLPKRTKDLLKAMVKNHASAMQEIEERGAESVNEIDLVQGKGKGLIIFLYGPPGVGKTSTAETIAAYSSPAKPLYPITCGDLGSNPVEIQEKLDSHFTLAHRWKCVLLLDEADVYLAERDIHDLNRNGIVSVFLRNLEYYSGILFLTSNREGLIDEAFKSRIHIALRYKAIDLNGTEQIWRNILRKIERENANKKVERENGNKKRQGVPVSFDEEELIEWAREHFDENSTKKADSANSMSTATWNGRQIRNAFQTALALASYARLERLNKKGYTEEEAMKKGPKYSTVALTCEHFDRVAKVVGEFEDYLVKCRGDDAERAAKEQWRKDNHDPGAPRVSAYQTDKVKGTPRGGYGNRHREYPDPEEFSSVGMQSPSRSRGDRGDKRRQLEDDDEIDEALGRNAPKETKKWQARQIRDLGDDTDSE